MSPKKRRFVGFPIRSLADELDAALAGATPAVRVSAHGGLVEIGGRVALRVDASGRWSALRLAGTLWRRTMDGGVVRYPGPAPVPESAADPAAIHAHAIALAEQLYEQLAHPQLGAAWPARDGALLREHLDRARQWTPERYEAEAPRFERAYEEPVEILPPDRYLDLVVLPATGCPNAGCTFCAFYRERQFRPKTSAELTAHLAAVEALFGAALPQRDGIFLGSASALSLSQRRLHEALQQVHDTFGPRRRGTAAFWDPDHAPPRDARDWDALHRAGLAAVYVGLETGVPELRARIGKSAEVEQLVAAIAAQRSSAIRTGIIVLAGVGGEAAASRHIELTTATIARLGLGRRDVVFVSPLRGAMPRARLDDATRRLRDSVRQRTAAKVAPYAMDAFRYYA